MVWLPDERKNFTCLAVSTEYRRVTFKQTDRGADRCTDRQTDIRALHTCRAPMSLRAFKLSVAVRLVAV